MFQAIIFSTSISCAFTGFCFWLLSRQIRKMARKDKGEKECIKNDTEKQDKVRIENEIILIELMNANIALCESIARSVQRMSDTDFNSDIHAALNYVTEVKRDYKPFITERGIKTLY